MRLESKKSKFSNSRKRSKNNRSAAECETHASKADRDNCKFKHAGLRETRYRPEYARIAERFCRLGATNADLSLAFNVSLGTISEWQESVEEFKSACKIGTEMAVDHVERSLYQSALGYEYLAEVAFHYEGRVIIKKYLKHVPANVSASIFFLCNRCPEEWSRNPVPKQGSSASTDVSESTQSDGNELDRLFRSIAAGPPR